MVAPSGGGGRRVAGREHQLQLARVAAPRGEQRVSGERGGRVVGRGAARRRVAASCSHSAGDGWSRNRWTSRPLGERAQHLQVAGRQPRQPEQRQPGGQVDERGSAAQPRARRLEALGRAGAADPLAQPPPQLGLPAASAAAGRRRRDAPLRPGPQHLRALERIAVEQAGQVADGGEAPRAPRPPPRWSARLRSHGSPSDASTTSSSGHTARSGSHGSCRRDSPTRPPPRPSTSRCGEGKSTFAQIPGRVATRSAGSASAPSRGWARPRPRARTGPAAARRGAGERGQRVRPFSTVNVKHRLTSFHCTKGSDPSRVGRRAGWRRRTSSARAKPFTLGVEEELFLVDPRTGEQMERARGGLDRLGQVDGTVERELHACQVELITGVCATAGEAVDAWPGLRARCGARAPVLGAGMHPSAPEGGAGITDKERYARSATARRRGRRPPRRTTRSRRDARSRDAIRAFNGLRRTCRCCRRWAPTRRSGTGATRTGLRAGDNHARVAALGGAAGDARLRGLLQASSALLARAADVPDYTWFWWKLRPHPRLGTVEIRALDAQTSLTMSGLVALAHCLAATGPTSRPGPDDAIRDPRRGRLPRRALRHRRRAARRGRATARRSRDARRGARARSGRTQPSSAARPSSRRCAALVESGGGAGRQRAPTPSVAWARCCAG